MKKILAGFIMDGRGGGVDKHLLRLLDMVEHGDVKVDYLTNEIDKDLEKRLAQAGCHLYEVPSLHNPIGQYRGVYNLLKKEQYDVTYFNISTAVECVAAFAAKKAGIKKRILHSHSSGIDRESKAVRGIYTLLHRIGKLFLYKSATDYYACSVKAGLWLFPKKVVESEKFKVIYNAVDGKKYSFNEETRKRVRKSLGLEDKFVIGHVGRFDYQKNHEFLIQIFAEIAKQKEEVVLLLVGEGEKEAEIKKLVHSLHLEEKVHFLGLRKDTADLYQAMDVFLLPSRFEGLPIVGVEAQYAKLPCVFSDAITKETKLHKYCSFISLNRNPAQWAEKILKLQQVKRADIVVSDPEGHYDETIQNQHLKELLCN